MFLSEIKIGEAHRDGTKVLFWPSDKAVSDRIFAHLSQLGFRPLVTGEASVIAFLAEDVEALAKALQDVLSVAERKVTRALTIGAGDVCLGDFGRVVSVEHFMHHHSSRWVVDLLDQRRFKSVMQPIMRTDGHTVHGYEFLFRGMQTDGDMINPVEIFNAAKEPELLARLDREARVSALKTAVRFGLKEKLFINVLPSSVAADGDIDGTLEWVADLNIPPQQVVFEIVESQAVEDVSHLARLFELFRANGYQIALDDFGSGFNNLTTMIQLKPDYIKLDKSLITHVTSDPHRWNLIANMIDAAKQNKISVVAEGVENEQVHRMLVTLGADFLQGYFYATPGDRPINLAD